MRDEANLACALNLVTGFESAQSLPFGAYVGGGDPTGLVWSAKKLLVHALRKRPMAVPRTCGNIPGIGSTKAGPLGGREDGCRGSGVGPAPMLAMRSRSNFSSASPIRRGCK
jgi:hypothetical protein